MRISLNKLARLSCFAIALVFAMGIKAAEVKDSVASTEDELPTDLYASIVIADPGPDFISTYGHCGLRLRCPSRKLDMCSSFVMPDDFENQVGFFAGTALASFTAFLPNDYLVEYRAENRAVREYPLNLTTEQVRQLWYHLECGLNRGKVFYYNFVHTHCVSMVLYAIEDCLGDECHLEFEALDETMTGNVRNWVWTLSEVRPWLNLFWQTVLGAEGSDQGVIEEKIAPNHLVYALSGMYVVNNKTGEKVRLCDKEPSVVLPGSYEVKQELPMPLIVFSLVLALAIAVTIAQVRYGRKKEAKCFDVLLMVAYTGFGIFLCALSFLSKETWTANNVMVILFNPLPLLAWIILFKKKSIYNKVLCAFGVVALAFVVLTPFVQQFMIEHALAAATLALRCFAPSIPQKK